MTDMMVVVVAVAAAAAAAVTCTNKTVAIQIVPCPIKTKQTHGKM
jgi:hypothetical protein